MLGVDEDTTRSMAREHSGEFGWQDVEAVIKGPDLHGDLEFAVGDLHILTRRLLLRGGDAVAIHA